MNYKVLLSVIITLFLGSACSKNEILTDGENIIIEGKEIFVEDIPYNSSIEEENVDSLTYKCILNNLWYVDSLSNGQVEYKSYFGSKLYPEQPKNYYIAVEDTKEAEDYFRNLIIAIIARDSVKQMNNGDLVLNTIGGNLTFHKNNSDVIATVDVNLKDLPQIKKYIFISNDEWPKNEGEDVYTKPITKGSLWKRDNGWYYICVRESGYNSNGILITFDGGWDRKEYKSDKVNRTYNINCSPENVLGDLRNYYFENDLIFKNKFKNIDLNNYNYSETLKVLNRMAKSYEIVFQIGTPSVDKHNFIWLGDTHLKTTMSYFTFSPYNSELRAYSSTTCCNVVKEEKFLGIKTKVYYYVVEPHYGVPSSCIPFSTEEIKNQPDNCVKFRGYTFNLVGQ